VLDAERSLFNAQLSETQTHAAALASFVTLYKAMGGGWVVTADQMTTQTATTPADGAKPAAPAAPTVQ
jgi:multidrug efflux system outer membrane protein